MTRLVWITPDAEQQIEYCARVSNPKGQDKVDTTGKLLRYCVAHNHWSVFEMASACVEISTTRDISAQILRHRSFSFQEFSQRYAEVSQPTEQPQWRRQDVTNKQNSIDDLSEEVLREANEVSANAFLVAKEAYDHLLRLGVAKECARKVLPINSPTRLYMSGTIRSWIHYLSVRRGPETQLEHRLIADEIKNILNKEMPHLWEVLT
jgi:thymidylate synthase (FAD)